MILKQTNFTSIASYLRAQGWLQAGEEVKTMTVPGSGNMNYVLRIDTGERSFIVKQAMPWVEKFPQVAAPRERLVVEHRFYEFISKQAALHTSMPGLIGFDGVHFILCLQDAGDMPDATAVYHQPGHLNGLHITTLVAYLNALHTLTLETDMLPFFANEEMRRLNALHIFEFPLMANNGFRLDEVQPGLEQIALPFKNDAKLKSAAAALKEAYLAAGPCLQHGDYYPGSWLVKETAVKIIDPEFCFAGGVACFDTAVMLAHLRMAGCAASLLEKVTALYTPVHDRCLLNAFTGIEMMRRIIGLAQLPLALSLTAKKELLAGAREMALQVI